MQKRMLIGLIPILLALAVQDDLFGTKAGSSTAQSGQTSTNDPIASAPDLCPSHSTADRPVNEFANSLLVTRVVDGDTIIVLIDGVSEKVRLIGVDTPETVDPRKTVQCFGKEASAFTKALLMNTSVELEIDPTQGDRDKYGRMLRYVFLLDGTLVNQRIIADGYGHEYTYKIPYKYQEEFKNAERSARESKKGLWGPGACGD